MKKDEEKRRENLLRRQGGREACRIMWPAILLAVIFDLFDSTLLVEAANRLGQFAESALALDWSMSAKSGLMLAVCVVLTIVVPPLINKAQNICWVLCDCKHEKLVFRRFFEKSPEKVRAADSGELRFELENAAGKLRMSVWCLLGCTLAPPLCMIYLLWCAGRVSWLLTCVMFALAVLSRLIPGMFIKWNERFDKNEQEYFARRKSRETDVTGAPHLIRLWGVSGPVLGRFYGLFGDYYKKHGAKYDRFGAVEEQYDAMVEHFTKVLLFVVGAALVAKGSVRAGELISVMIYFSATEDIMQELGAVIRWIPRLKNAAKRVAAICSDPEQPKELKAEQFTGLRTKDLCFSFDDTQVLHNVDLAVDPGDKVAIVGENGSGKSTLGRVMATLLTGYTGEVSVNGAELHTLDADSWRARIAYAPQDAYLFSTTVRENVLMGNPDADEETVQKMMEAFGVAELADREISEESDLSGGERQKISILRALIKDADVLVLDEPTNHLDKESVERLTDHLKATEQTVVVISHDEAIIGAMRKRIPIT